MQSFPEQGRSMIQIKFSRVYLLQLTAIKPILLSDHALPDKMNSTNENGS